ncbi:MAG: hypothetical protein CMQ45_02285 [Gammaproteobacteria bacterium]|mgnify:CR=1 FL=1|nr:hypothetical protein [Gammaproteobacteria bacterium]
MQGPEIESSFFVSLLAFGVKVGFRAAMKVFPKIFDLLPHMLDNLNRKERVAVSSHAIAK